MQFLCKAPHWNVATFDVDTLNSRPRDCRLSKGVGKLDMRAS